MNTTIKTTYPPLIGLTGPAGAGKDTTAAHLVEAYGYASIAFAAPIRRGISAMLQIAPERFQHPLKEQVLPQFGKSPREMMQTLGTEWGRNLVHPDLWLIIARAEIMAAWQRGRAVVVTDVRFDNEAQLLREMNGEIWHIERHGAGTTHRHASENGVRRSWNDIALCNEGRISDLHRAVDEVLA